MAMCASGADPGFEKGGFDLVLKSDTGGATNNEDFLKHRQGSIKSDIQVEYEAT